MKSILGVVGSPRKMGNTHVLVSQIIEGAKSKGASTDLILLGDLNIRECDGCHVCWKEKPCCKNDDMLALYDKIIASDIIIFGTPVYWYGPTALMKAFMDRFVYFNCPENRNKIKGKSAILAIPYEEDSFETGEYVADYFAKCLHYLEIPIIGKIIVSGVTERGEVQYKIEAMTRAYELGQICLGD